MERFFSESSTPWSTQHQTTQQQTTPATRTRPQPSPEATAVLNLTREKTKMTPINSDKICQMTPMIGVLGTKKNP